ncbi:MAG: dihydrolipoyl dehydrogenase [Candidatus Dasytiphilus stammeri]
MNKDLTTNVVVIGSGPAGYSAAFRCADLGLSTILVERYNTLGGVCLNVGCIPSKTLLNIANFIDESKKLNNNGIISEIPFINLDKICSWKVGVVKKLTDGLAFMAKRRKVLLVNGIGKFYNRNTLLVNQNNLITKIKFEHAIIATGSRATKVPFIDYNDSRVWDSTDALELKTIPSRLLIIGGGIIGLEMGTIYHALGSKIDIVEIQNQLVPGTDKDIIDIYTRQIRKKFNLMLETKIIATEYSSTGILVKMQDAKKIYTPPQYDAILIAVGRIPNYQLLDLTLADINLDPHGFIIVDKQMRTNIPHIYAIGDIIGQPMLAHKGIHEGHIAAEVIAGNKHYFEPKVIPSVIYTEPELAWTGITEQEAKKLGINYDIAVFPWIALGRALASDCSEGATKLIFNAENRIIGGAIVGKNGSELLGEINLAIEMGCDVEDIALTIHAHPTLHESIGRTAEMIQGTVTDLLNLKHKNHFKL